MGLLRDGATTGAIVEIFQKTLGTKPRNSRYLAQILRDAGLLSGEGDHAGARLTTAEAVSWFIGQVASPSLPRAPDTISQFRTAPFKSMTIFPIDATPVAFAEGLSLPFGRTFGDALDGLLDDMRSGAFARWSDLASSPTLDFEFHENGAVQIHLSRPYEAIAMMFSYGTADDHLSIERVLRLDNRLAIDRIVRVDGLAVFSNVATALGPLASAQNKTTDPARPAALCLENM